MDVSWMTKYIAEGLGTMLLVLLGNGTIAGVTLKGSKNEGMGGLAIAWGYGIAMLVPVLAFANVSGAHINPAITLGLASAGYSLGLMLRNISWLNLLVQLLVSYSS